jgi:hypothetical protein
MCEMFVHFHQHLSEHSSGLAVDYVLNMSVRRVPSDSPNQLIEHSPVETHKWAVCQTYGGGNAGAMSHDEAIRNKYNLKLVPWGGVAAALGIAGEKMMALWFAFLECIFCQIFNHRKNWKKNILLNSLYVSPIYRQI